MGADRDRSALKVEHWESYYRGGWLTACPTGPDPNYTLELREIWSDFFASLADGARILDIGTGNGAIAVIARETATKLGRTFDIHGADLAQIDPVRDVAGGARLFADISFHPGVAAEKLPFEAASFAAVSGQYALEYTDMRESLAQVLRVLKPGSGAQFLMHHAGSIVVERARASLRHADAVLMETKIHRKLRRFLKKTLSSVLRLRHAVLGKNWPQPWRLCAVADGRWRPASNRCHIGCSTQASRPSAQTIPSGARSGDR